MLAQKGVENQYNATNYFEVNCKTFSYLNGKCQLYIFCSKGVTLVTLYSLEKYNGKFYFSNENA